MLKDLYLHSPGRIRKSTYASLIADLSLPGGHLPHVHAFSGEAIVGRWKVKAG